MFVLVGLFATTVLYVVVAPWTTWKKYFVVSCVAIATLIIWTANSVSSRGALEWWQDSLWRNLLLYAVMLAGMMFRVLWDTVEVWRKHNAQPDVRRRRRPRFEFWEFVYPLIPSLVVFQAVLWVAEKQDVSIQLLLASFQNGFFWHAVFARTQQTVESAGRG